MTVPNHERAFRHLIQRYKQLSKFRKMEFDLTNDQILLLFKGNCKYCGIKPEQIHKGLGNCEPFIYNGIDRLDSSKGYIQGNCVPCCKSCNSIKHITDINQIIQPNKWYGNYLTIRPTTERLHGQVVWECHHQGTIKKVIAGNLRREEKFQKIKQVD
jgi:hypothetical protein